MAVRLERAHAQYPGENASLAVVDFGALALRRLVPHRNLIEQVQGEASWPRSWCARAGANACSARASTAFDLL